MFDSDILRLYEQGLTSAAIAKRVGCSAGYVRSVVWHQGTEAKPVYDPVLIAWRKQQAAQQAAEKRAAKARRADVEAKRAKVLRRLEAAEAKLSNLNSR